MTIVARLSSHICSLQFHETQLVRKEMLGFPPTYAAFSFTKQSLFDNSCKAFQRHTQPSVSRNRACSTKYKYIGHFSKYTYIMMMWVRMFIYFLYFDLFMCENCFVASLQCTSRIMARTRARMDIIKQIINLRVFVSRRYKTITWTLE